MDIPEDVSVSLRQNRLVGWVLYMSVAHPNRWGYTGTALGIQIEGLSPTRMATEALELLAVAVTEKMSSTPKGRAQLLTAMSDVEPEPVLLPPVQADLF